MWRPIWSHIWSKKMWSPQNIHTAGVLLLAEWKRNFYDAYLERFSWFDTCKFFCRIKALSFCFSLCICTQNQRTFCTAAIQLNVISLVWYRSWFLPIHASYTINLRVYFRERENAYIKCSSSCCCCSIRPKKSSWYGEILPNISFFSMCKFIFNAVRGSIIDFSSCTEYMCCSDQVRQSATQAYLRKGGRIRKSNITSDMTTDHGKWSWPKEHCKHCVHCNLNKI